MKKFSEQKIYFWIEKNFFRKLKKISWKRRDFSEYWKEIFRKNKIFLKSKKRISQKFRKKCFGKKKIFGKSKKNSPIKKNFQKILKKIFWRNKKF